ncbi:hypothetical protein SMICM304S_08366 [Streptomyces microflavus]
MYEVEDVRIVDPPTQMAKDSRQQGWWHAFGDIPYSVYIGLETDAESLRVYEPQMVPGLLQTRAYAEALISGALPEGTAVGHREARQRSGFGARTGSTRRRTRCGCGP